MTARARAPGRLRGAAVDCLTVAAAGALAAWQLLIEPLFAADYPLAQRLVPVLHPICDVVLVAAVLFLALSPGRRGGSIRLLLGAACGYLTVDVAYNVLPYFVDYTYVVRLNSVLARFGVAVREQERAQVRLAHRASRDELTGLANRAELTDRLDRAGASGAVLFLDLDGFKQVNDEHGHDAGDAVLVAAADRLRAAVRATDLVARLGGDEFVVLCPDLDRAGAVALAERVLADLAGAVPFHGHALTVGASIGIAVHGRDLSTPADLLRAADAAMYTAKRQGRRRLVVAGAAPPVLEGAA